MIISKDAEKAFDKILHPFIIKTLFKWKKSQWNIITDTYDKSTANIILNIVKLKAFPLRSGTRYEYLILPLLFSIVLEILGTTVRQGKRNKMNLNQKGRSKTATVGRWQHTIHRKSLKWHKETTRAHQWIKVVGYRINIWKYVAFLHSSN